MTDTLEAVRAKVIEAVPEIVEVKPGCVLNLHAGESFGWMTVHQATSVCKKHKKFREDCVLEENGCSSEESVFGTSSNDENYWEHTVKIADIKPYQIIGRSITLADVLRAIYKAEGGMLVSVDTTGTFWRIAPTEMISPSYCWNLALSLDEQEPEIIEFLHKILCV